MPRIAAAISLGLFVVTVSACLSLDYLLSSLEFYSSGGTEYAAVVGTAWSLISGDF